MRVIWKTRLVIGGDGFIDIPKGGEILHAGVQNGALQIWYLCDPNAELSERKIYVVGTGNMMKDEEFKLLGRYIGTVHLSNFVWHLFEGK